MYLSKWLKLLFNYLDTDIHRELCLRQKTKEAKEKIFKFEEVGFRYTQRTAWPNGAWEWRDLAVARPSYGVTQRRNPVAWPSSVSSWFFFFFYGSETEMMVQTVEMEKKNSNTHTQTSDPVCFLCSWGCVCFGLRFVWRLFEFKSLWVLFELKKFASWFWKDGDDGGSELIVV